jgi:asparagine synthase (glutamine-hydrolysing)
MCGIFSAINLKSYFTNNDFDKFKKSTDIVNYRGPDASGHLKINSKAKELNTDNYNIFFGHRRLSIIDLTSEGNQPMIDNDYIIVYNGEIFNYLELKKQLSDEGVIFKTRSDTEVILKLYQKFGSKAFKKLNGMWAFVILDMKANKIIASRDRFSIKPLFYYKNQSSIYFASEIKQILPFIDTKEINKGIVYNYLQQTLLDHNEKTFFVDIFKVKPKTNLIIDLNNSTVVEEQYWDYENVEVDYKDIYSQFREIFTDSIKIRLRSDVNIGALLSGGLDSSAISVIADNLLDNKLQTFSIISDAQHISEEKYIDILSGEKGIRNTKLTFTNDEVINNIDKVVFHQDEPFIGFSIVAQYTIFKLIKQHTDIVVILSGQGGDEILMGYLKYFFFYLQNLKNNGKYFLALKELLASLLARTVIWQFRLNTAKRYIPFFMNRKDDYITISGELEKTWDSQNIKQRQILDIDKYSVPSLAHFEDRNSTAHSLESRLPFLDHRLVNLLLSIGSDMKIKNGWTKYILRKSIHELPERIKWRRDKKGFDVPEEKWLKSDLKDEILNLFEKSVLDQLGIINQKKFLSYYQQFLNGNKTIFSSDIAKVFIAEKWARNNFC